MGGRTPTGGRISGQCRFGSSRSIAEPIRQLAFPDGTGVESARWIGIRFAGFFANSRSGNDDGFAGSVAAISARFGRNVDIAC